MSSRPSVPSVVPGALLSVAVLALAARPAVPSGVVAPAEAPPIGPGADTVVVTPERAPMSSVAFSPDARRVASSSLDGRVYLWDAATGRELRRLDGHGEEAYAVAFSPGGDRLATAGREGGVKIRDPATGDIDRTLDADPWALDLAFSPGGEELLVVEVDGDVVVHPLGEGTADTLATGRGAVAAAWSPAGGRLASAFGRVLVHRRPGSEPPDTLAGHGHVVMELAFTPEGDRLASSSIDASTRLWDLTSGTAVDTLVHDLPAPFVAISPDGRRLATGGAGRTVRVWPLADLSGEGTPVVEHGKSVTGVAFSPDGRRVASSGLDGRVRIAPVPDAP